METQKQKTSKQVTKLKTDLKKAETTGGAYTLSIYTQAAKGAEWVYMQDVQAATPYDVYRELGGRGYGYYRIRSYINTSTARGLHAAIITVVKRATATALTYGYTELQRALYEEARRVYIDYSDPAPINILYDYNRYSYDMQDLLSVVQLGFLAAIASKKSIIDQYSAAYSALNSYMDSMRAARISSKPLDFSIEALTEAGIQIIDVGKTTAALINPNKAIPVYDGQNTAHAVYLRAVAESCSPVQLKVFKLWAKNYTQRTIAERLKRSVSTTHGHIAAIRKKAAEIAKDHRDAIPKNITSADLFEMIQKGKKYQK